MRDSRFQAAWHSLADAEVAVIDAGQAYDAQPPRPVRERLADALAAAKLATLKIQEILSDTELT